MNSAVITKIEYKLPGAADFDIFDIVPETGKLSEDHKIVDGNLIYTTIIDFLIAGLNIDLKGLIRSLEGRKCYFRITDADDLIYLVGSVDYMARLSAELDLGGTPGSFKGYRCKISLISTTGLTLE